MLDLDSFLISLYVLVDDWWKASRSCDTPRPGRPALLADSEVLTLAILCQWPRFRSERDFWRFASSHLREYFPTLCSQSQFNRRVRALAPEVRALHHHLAKELAEPSAAYHVLDTTLIPAIVRVRASRKGLFCGQASFGRSASKTEWVYGFKVGLTGSPQGVITAFGVAEVVSEERPIADWLIRQDRHELYLADKGFACVGWERHWAYEQGSLVVATPKDNSKRAWSRSDRLWAAGKRQIIEGVIDQLKDIFALERHRAKTLGGAFDPPSCQGRSLHLRAEAQRPARSSAAPLSRSIGLKSYASVVLGSRALYSIPNGMWKVASPKVVSRSPQTHTRVNKGRRTS